MKGEEEKDEKKIIMIKEDWLNELNKYHYFSSNTYFINVFRKTW